MEVHITRQTPPDQVLATLQAEIDKAYRWHIKNCGGSEKRDKYNKTVNSKLPNDQLFVFQSKTSYTSKQSNRWIIFDYAVRKPETALFNNYVDFLVPVEDGDDNYIMRIATNDFSKPDVAGYTVFEKSFFDGIKSKDDKKDDTYIEKAIRFFSNEGIFCTGGDEDGVIYMRFDGGIGTGKRIDNIIHIDKVIYDEDLDPATKEIIADIIAERDERVAKELESTDEDKEYFKHYVILQERIKEIKKYQRSYFFTADTETVAAVYYQLSKAIMRASKRRVPFGIIPIDKFFFDRIKVISRQGENKEQYAEELTKLAWHSGADDIELEDMIEEVKNYFDDKSKAEYSQLQQQQNIMNQKAKTMFKNLLSQTGLTKKFSKYAESVDTLEKYLEKVETLYVFTRLTPFVVDIKDKEKMLNANRLWLAIVAKNRFSKELTKYTEEYGDEHTLQAINYLIDCDAWLSPEGNKALKQPQPTNYDGLKDIPAAIEYLKEHGLIKEPTPSAEAPVEEPAVEEQSAQAPAEEPRLSSNATSKDATELANKAHKAVGDLLKHIGGMKDQLDILTEYWSENADDNLETILMSENTELLQKVYKAEKERDDVIEQIKVSQMKLHDQESKAKKAEELAYQARKERADMVRERDEAKAELRKVQGALDELKQASVESSLPKAKIIPLSKFLDIPLVGPGVLKGIIPMLKKYNIIVDEKK